MSYQSQIHQKVKQTLPQNPIHKNSTTVEKSSESIVEYLLPKDSPYFALKQIESQLDSKLLERQQKLVDIQFKKEKSLRKVLIRVGNSCSSQRDNNNSDSASMENNLTYSNNEDLFKSPPSWSLRIEGKLEPTVGRPSRFAPPPFLNWIKSFTVDFTDDQGNLVFVEEWKKDTNSKLSDTILIKRTGSKPLNVKILLDIDYHVEKFRLSTPLAEILQTDVASKAHVLVMLWQYVKLNKLQVSEKSINADGPLQKVFGMEKLQFSDIPILISKHLFPPKPLVLEYRLQLDTPQLTFSPEVYELIVEYDERSTNTAPLKLNHPALLTLTGEISLIEKKIAEHIELLKVSLANERILSQFAKNPVSACEAALINQCRDIRTVTGELSSFSMEDLFRDELFQGQNIEYALFEYADLKL